MDWGAVWVEWHPSEPADTQFTLNLPVLIPDAFVRAWLETIIGSSIDGAELVADEENERDLIRVAGSPTSWPPATSESAFGGDDLRAMVSAALDAAFNAAAKGHESTDAYVEAVRAYVR